MKKIIICFLLVFTGFYTQTMAQSTPSAGEIDPRAEKLLKKSSEEYSSFNSMKADFTMKVENRESKVVKSNQGTLWIKGKKFKFKFGAITVYGNETTLWTYNKGIDEVQITDYDPQTGQITPTSIFSDFYNKDFLYRLKDNESTEKSAVIGMTPRDKSKPYFKIVVWLNKESHHIEKMKIFNKNGFRYLYHIDSFVPDFEVDPSKFTFSKENYPGVSVQDLRL